ncbi:unnamed protein product [Mytilus edulis]|uniref:B box-type domain-containing protein n=1 Tax=Mytilus edulis TaxID=6550 RepID=A0A8S3UWS8_MYTED|nr:unnamed protein product [Mytilus edulis]
MASNWSLCGVCENLQITKSSVVWCSECGEGLCGDCKEHHSISKGTTSHETVAIDEYKNVTDGSLANRANGCLIFCAREKGMKKISLSDESITNVINNKLSTLAYVTTFGDKLFYTNYTDDSVTCCNYHGNILWKFCDTSVLKSPFGISVDHDGNVFVVGRLTHNVVVISPDGQRCRQLF